MAEFNQTKKVNFLIASSRHCGGVAPYQFRPARHPVLWRWQQQRRLAELKQHAQQSGWKRLTNHQNNYNNFPDKGP